MLMMSIHLNGLIIRLLLCALSLLLTVIALEATQQIKLQQTMLLRQLGIESTVLTLDSTKMASTIALLSSGLTFQCLKLKQSVQETML